MNPLYTEISTQLLTVNQSINQSIRCILNNTVIAVKKSSLGMNYGNVLKFTNSIDLMNFVSFFWILFTFLEFCFLFLHLSLVGSVRRFNWFHWLIDWFHPLIDWFIHWVIDSIDSIDWLINLFFWLIDWFHRPENQIFLVFQCLTFLKASRAVDSLDPAPASFTASRPTPWWSTFTVKTTTSPTPSPTSRPPTAGNTRTKRSILVEKKTSDTITVTSKATTAPESPSNWKVIL